MIFIERKEAVSLKIHLIPIELPLHDLEDGLVLDVVDLTDFLHEFLCFLELLIDEKARRLEVEKGSNYINYTSRYHYLIGYIFST